jgi:hypothetical protein
LSGIHMWFGCECCIGEAAASTARTIERNTWEKSTGFITHITCQQIQLRCTIRLSILSDCQFTGLKHKHWTETQPCSTSTYGQNTSHEISTGTHISASSFCGRKSKETSKRGLNWHLAKKKKTINADVMGWQWGYILLFSFEKNLPSSQLFEW